ncbi:hypothetical protein IPA_01905 [Ignicoccus pacificus DSM 13166]|uniref:Uncharacterized protein n=1 Tax=Ignicoccus pacificus DSM 13166 TaxID=940294 RepID=A0A977KAK7_9CREN|nr:hypothetical protein IPA_01905 [Ignicoccus pacificus DSM 13166]
MKLGKRDPQGYFVILADPRAKETLPEGVETMDEGDVLIIRVKSRSLATKIVRKLEREGLLRGA